MIWALWLTLFSCILLSRPSQLQPLTFGCNLFDPKTTGSPEQCKSIDGTKKFQNLPIINGVYCNNDGSGLCKAFAGKFEFYFNSFDDAILYAAPASSDKDREVDEFGLHKRKPQAYDINGNIIYADQSINWARDFKNFTNNAKMSLLSVNSIDWCQYVRKNNWPYRSAFLDKKTNRFEVYFFNRQTCIYDKQNNKMQNFNTRFLGLSKKRIDLDVNPLIFTMEDSINKDIRIVKHKRQHWYEIPYKVVDYDGKTFKYFIEFEDEQTPCKINSTSSNLFGINAYRKFNNVCISDIFNVRKGPNNPLLQIDCGVDTIELADYPITNMGPHKLISVGLHNIPRFPLTAESFFRVNVTKNEDWETFAKDGYTFTAATTIPLDESKPNVIRAIVLYADFKISQSDPHDENYPQVFLSDYTARYLGDQLWDASERETKRNAIQNLNYVDDIAYLHKCQTILIIFGPLYSELPKNEFSMTTLAPIDSIYNLGLYEPVNAFFAMPGENTIWFYIRTNFVVEVKYTCASDNDSLVTGQQAGVYYSLGSSQPPWSQKNQPPHDFTEEFFFSQLGIYKGSLEMRSLMAPDPDLYRYKENRPAPEVEGNNTLLYVIIGIAILLLLAMCIACLVTLRRRRKTRHHGLGQPTQRSGMAGSSMLAPSARSALTSRQSSHSPKSARSKLSKMGTSSPRMTTRSGLSNSKMGSLKGSARSSLSKGSSGHPRSRSTIRSNLTNRSSGTPLRTAATSPTRALSTTGSQSRHSSRSGR